MPYGVVAGEGCGEVPSSACLSVREGTDFHRVVTASCSSKLLPANSKQSVVVVELVEVVDDVDDVELVDDVDDVELVELVELVDVVDVDAPGRQHTLTSSNAGEMPVPANPNPIRMGSPRYMLPCGTSRDTEN